MNATLTKTHAEYFTRLKEELAKPQRLFAYNLTHTMNVQPGNLFALVTTAPFTLCGVLAYIEHVTFELTNACSYSLSESELLEIINEFYFKVTLLEAEPLGSYHEIDLYENWEAYAGFPYEEQMPELRREGLLDFVREMAVRNDWKQEHTQV